MRRDQRQDLLRRRETAAALWIANAFAYNPAANTWIPIASVLFTTSEAAVTVANDELLLAGGDIQQGSNSFMASEVVACDPALT
ncbi:MAG TPA: hypothetical protein VF060_04780 [Trebonia sp.]